MTPKNFALALALTCLISLSQAAPVPEAINSAAIMPRTFSSAMLNPDITQANIQETVCRKHFTKTIRPGVAYTNNVKFRLMRDAGIPEEDAGLFELDHIVPLSIGGHPRNLVNLMLQPYQGVLGAKQKDRLELKLQNMVCDGDIDLATAQKEIGGDWVAAYRKFIKHKGHRKGRPDTGSIDTPR